MIRTTRVPTGQVKVTFSLPDEGTSVAVIGCFNRWDPTIHRLQRRSNGRRSVAVTLDADQEVHFRYVATGSAGMWYFDDPDADGHEPNGFGQTHGVLRI